MAHLQPLPQPLGKQVSLPPLAAASLTPPEIESRPAAVTVFEAIPQQTQPPPERSQPGGERRHVHMYVMCVHTQTHTQLKAAGCQGWESWKCPESFQHPLFSGPWGSGGRGEV